MKENSIEDRIEKKYSKYLNRETDILELTIEEAIFILEKDKRNHYVEDLLQEAYKVILSDYKRLQEEFKQVDHECERLEQKEIRLEKKNEQLRTVVNSLKKENEELKHKYDKALSDLVKAEKENEELKDRWDKDTHKIQNDLDIANAKRIEIQKEKEELKKELGRVTYGRNQLFEYATAQQANPEMLHKVLRVEYIPKQKIKGKIEELNKKEKQELRGTKGQDRYDIKQQYMYQRNILQNLLEDKGE